ncbi:RNA polymerase sigma factor [Algisphaera agarilytica]|uniref:RNA polymerase sigma-70 factor (ECF subfamily) n=1 Tax=Algisphaera agarilytica TaxID=1385975 RepID=A0A7X0LJA2_9BACT|nr:RNA polymerase sigma factor [Algisphaera agarilytica]MBB6428564.1 RNA polymerase sigma-70 factor (ECF subfamily) [Algisphaera agarilytica]
MLDPEAFEAHFRAVSPRLMAIAFAICRQRDTAQDLVQEAGLVAWKKRNDFTEGTSFGAWTGQIVRNLALRHQRDTGRRAAILSKDASAVAPSASPPDTEPRGIDVQALNAESHTTSEAIGDRLGIDDDLAAALLDLSDDARACFFMRCLDKCSYAEITDALGLAPGTVMSHVHRSRNRILSRLASVPAPSKMPSHEKGES